MWNAKTRGRKGKRCGTQRRGGAKGEGVFSAKVALAEVMGGVFLRATSRHSCAGLQSFLCAASSHSRVGGNLGGMEGSARVWGMM